jgi:predicted enzyme related to lactoylglutathione lyase
MAAKVVLINVPTTDFDRSLKFYSTLLGVDPGRFVRNERSAVEQYYLPVSADGIDLTITDKQDSRETTITYYAVDSLEDTMKTLLEGGGLVVMDPVPLPGRDAATTADARARRRPPTQRPPGRTALMVDPDGNYLGLLELVDESAQEYFRLGKHREAVQELLEQRIEMAAQGATAS